MADNEDRQPNWTPPESPFERPAEFATTFANPEGSLFVEKLLLALVAANADGPRSATSRDNPKTNEGRQRARLRSAAEALFGRGFDTSPATGSAKRGGDVELLFKALVACDPAAAIRERRDGEPFEMAENADLWVALQQLETRVLVEDKDLRRKGAGHLEERLRLALDASSPISDDARVESDVRRIMKRFQAARLKSTNAQVDSTGAGANEPNGRTYIEADWEELRYLAGVAVGAPIAEECAMLASLRVIQSELAKWGVRMDVDVQTLGLAALWDNGARPSAQTPPEECI